MGKKEKLDSVCAILGEHFDDYLIVAREGLRGISWRSSDATWALGAAERYARGVIDADFLQQEEHFEEHFKEE